MGREASLGEESGTTEAKEMVNSPNNIEAWENEADGPLLTRKELWAWYMYAMATEPYNTCVAALFMPNSLALSAAMQGYELDHVTPCNYDVANYSCVIKWGGNWVNTSSYALFIQTIASLIQAVLYIGLGALADHSKNRKRFLFFFAFLGSIPCILMVACRTYKLLWLSSIFYALGSIGYGCSYVFYYAYIPIYARSHPRLIRSMLSRRVGYEIDDIPDSVKSTKLIKGKDIQKDKSLEPPYIHQILSNHISAFCTITSNGAAVIVLAISLVIIAFVTFDSLYAMYIGTCLVGVWWFVFSIWPLFTIKDRPGKPLPPGTNVITLSFKRTWSTLLRVREHPEMFKFLVAWFALADGSTTIINVSSLYAQNILNIDEIHLGIAIIIAPITTFIGAFLFLWIQKRFKISTYRMLVINCCFFIVLCVYIFIGYFTPAFGLRHSAELYPLVAYYGLVNGGLISLSRALFVDFCPQGRETEFFSIFELTDKGSSWVGPLVSAGISSGTHSVRYAYAWCIATIIVGTIILFFVNHEKGKEDVKKFANSEQNSNAFKTHDSESAEM
ncbi:Autophagy protein 22 [Mycoemilia scoparia]|uniref:Autophagy-related protein n=1 Tax=Mycoemilia scoparia TaxID=417184 RepID=A0A9W8DNF7_9FUNG|nr:Autophagy protein 22 [Mycoemilia scoparia]